MPTIISHAAVPLALGLAAGTRWVPPRLLWTGIALSMLPDLDVTGFHMGVPYGSTLGHRGFSHSLLAAALAAGLLAGFTGRERFRQYLGHLLFLFIAMASHGLLDMFTTGGKGVELLWPWSAHRFFAPWQVIRVSPLKLSLLLGERGLAVARSELLWIWLPAGVVSLLGILLRRFSASVQYRRNITQTLSP
jgi:inner membrane protein